MLNRGIPSHHVRRAIEELSEAAPANFAVYALRRGVGEIIRYNETIDFIHAAPVEGRPCAARRLTSGLVITRDGTGKNAWCRSEGK